jgi:hypothetical protein
MLHNATSQQPNTVLQRMDKSRRIRLVLTSRMSAELGIGLALNVGSLTTAHHQTILTELPSLRHSSQVPQFLAIELKKDRQSSLSYIAR